MLSILWSVNSLVIPLVFLLLTHTDGRLLFPKSSRNSRKDFLGTLVKLRLSRSLENLGNSKSDSTNIQIKDDGPTFFGTPTNFNIAIYTPVQGNIFISHYTYEPYRYSEVETDHRLYKFAIKDWRTTGTKLVYVRVKYKDSYGRMIVLGTNYTTVDVSDTVHCTVLVFQNGTRIQNGSISLGNVTFAMLLHDPSKLLKSGNITTVWSFSDGSPLVYSNTSKVSHFFSKEGTFTVQVLAFINVGKRRFFGNGKIILHAASKVKYELIVWQGVSSPEPRVPSRSQCVSTGKSFFFLRVLDPFNIFHAANFSYQWNFGGGMENLSKTNFATQVFNTVGHKQISVVVTAAAKSQVFSTVVKKTILVQEPLHSIAINGKSSAEKGELLTFNVTCKGSPPVSFCWYISEGGCRLPQNVICSPTVLYKSCWSAFYHKFRYSGSFCLNVSVINTVSFGHRQVQVVVKGVPEVDKSHIVAIASTLPFLAVFLLIITVFLAIKHSRGMYYRRNKKRSETAKFDFRASDNSFENWSTSGRCHQHVFCVPRSKCACSCYQNEEGDTDDMEEQMIFSDPSSPATPQRKTSYYGTIHMNLLQRNHNNPVLEKEEESAARESSMHHSV